MELFGVKEIREFAEHHDDERVRIMYQRLVESRSKQAQQHERISFQNEVINRLEKRICQLIGATK
jgi:hypothetical protein